MTISRDLTGLTGVGTAPPDRTVGAPPPRRRSPRPAKPSGEPAVALPSVDAVDSGVEKPRPRRPRTTPRHETSSHSATAVAATKPVSTVRISVNIPLTCRQWLSEQARERQRFVSEILMDAVDRHGEDVAPPSGRAKRVAVPDGTICNIVLPPDDRQRIDDLVARKRTTRSALLTEVLRRASGS